jgi:hypothetical protein
MMAGKFVVALALSLGLVSGSALAQSDGGAPAVSAPAGSDLFAKPLTLRGTLGDAKIEMHLQLKPDPTEGIQGSYVVAGQSAKILLAGESENTDVIMEESVNGKDVSGEWAGTLVGDTFRGTWSTTDDAVTKPFVLMVQRPAQAARTGK